MQMGDTSLYTPPKVLPLPNPRHSTLNRLPSPISGVPSQKNNSRMQPRSYVNTIQWDTDRHGLHIKVRNHRLP